MVRRLAESNQGKIVIITIPIESIEPHPQNPRIHNEKNIQAIMASISEFGQQIPIVLSSKNQIIKGCGTWEAMKRMELSTIQVTRATGLTEAQELAFALADNKTTDMSEFDFEGVADILKFLDDEGFDLEKTGFQEFEIEPLINPDWIPPVPPEKLPDPSKAYQLSFTESQEGILKRAIEHTKSCGMVSEEACDEEAFISICLFFLNEVDLGSSKKKPRRLE